MSQEHNETPKGDEADEIRRALLAVLPALALAGEAQAQDAVKTFPGAYRVVLENDKVRVLEYRSKPGLGVCGSGMHSHPAHLTVQLTPGKVRVKLPDGKVIIDDSPAGTTFWSEAETHDVENISGKDMRAILVEVKPPAARAKA